MKFGWGFGLCRETSERGERTEWRLKSRLEKTQSFWNDGSCDEYFFVAQQNLRRCGKCTGEWQVIKRLATGSRLSVSCHSSDLVKFVASYYVERVFCSFAMGLGGCDELWVAADHEGASLSCLARPALFIGGLWVMTLGLCSVSTGRRLIGGFLPLPVII